MRSKYFLFAVFILFPFQTLKAANPTTVTAEQALQELKTGNQRFVAEKPIHPNQDELHRKSLLEGQKPIAAVLGCADSRVPANSVFDQGLGDIFVARVAGNIVDDAVLGSLEYGVAKLGIPLIVVLGHEHCGAVSAALGKEPLPGHIEGIAAWIRQSIMGSTCDAKSQPTCATKANVKHIVEVLKKSSPLIAPQVQAGKVKIVGGYYHLGSGEVEWLAE